MVRVFFYQIFQIAGFEFKRFFKTRKGWLYLITYCFFWFLLIRYPVRFGAEFLDQVKEFQQHGLFDFFGLDGIWNWGELEFGIFWRLALIFFPIYSVLIAADQTSSDRERGTFKYLSLRCSREGIFFGRFVGAMMIQMALAVGVIILLILSIIFSASSIEIDIISSVFPILIGVFLIQIPFTAFMSVISVWLKSAKQSVALATFLLLFSSYFIALLSEYVPVINYLRLLIPGYEFDRMTGVAGWDVLKLISISMFQSILFLLLGRWLMLRIAL